VTADITLLLVAAVHAAQNEERDDRQDRQHEEGDRGAARDVPREDADLEGVAREDVREVTRAAIGQHAHDVVVREGDDQAEQHGDGDDVRHHRHRDVAQPLPAGRAVDRRRLV
jgi:regulator of protease activity HflC (stomatin/prohibitin superfamily)